MPTDVAPQGQVESPIGPRIGGRAIPKRAAVKRRLNGRRRVLALLGYAGSPFEGKAHPGAWGWI